MSTTFAIPPASLSGLAAISPTAFQLLTTGTSATSTTVFDSASSIVEVSALGQLLAAGVTLENSLQALQGDAATATPASVASQAEDFVTAFNAVQQSIVDIQPLLGALPDSALVDQFSITLNVAASSGLGSLQSIGITQSTIPGANGLPIAGLSIDQNVLDAAAASDPDGTLALLAQATQPLLLQVATFEAQATSTAVLPTDLTVQGTGIATDLLQNLSADTVLNNIQLSDLDLASLGLDANTLQSTGTALASSLSATLAPSAATTTLTAEELLLPATTLPAATDTATARAAAVLATLNPVATATSEALTTSTLTTPGTTATQAIVASSTVTTATLSASAADAMAAEQAVSAATINLQNLLNDPGLRAINNSLFNPLYSALIAASHQSDFASPMPLIRANAIPAEIPVPVIPVVPVRPISDYNETASEFGRRQIQGKPLILVAA